MLAGLSRNLYLYTERRKNQRQLHVCKLTERGRVIGASSNVWNMYFAYRLLLIIFPWTKALRIHAKKM